MMRSQHHLPRDAPAASADRRRGTARRRSRHGQGARGRGRRRCWCCARSTRKRSPASRWTRFFNSESHGDSFAEAASYAPDPEAALGPDEYLEHLRRVKEAVADPGDRLAQRRHARRLDLLRAALEEAGADGLELHLYHAASDMTTSAAEVERQIDRDRARGEADASHPGRRQALAALHRVRPLRQAARRGRRRRARALHALPPVDIDVDELEVVRTLPLSDSSELPLRLRGDGGAGGARQGVARHHRRRPHRPRRGQGDDGRRARHADGLGAAPQRPRPPAHGPRARSRPGWREHEWSSLDEMRGNMSLERIPDPAAYERANFRMMLR